MNELPKQDEHKETACLASPIVERCVMLRHQAIRPVHVVVEGFSQICNSCGGSGAEPSACTTIMDVCCVCNGIGTVRIAT